MGSGMSTNVDWFRACVLGLTGASPREIADAAGTKAAVKYAALYPRYAPAHRIVEGAVYNEETLERFRKAWRLL